jgi:hypothetical protein
VELDAALPGKNRFPSDFFHRHLVNMHDTQGARRLLAGLKYFVPRLKKIWADSAYRGKELADWCQAQGD